MSKRITFKIYTEDEIRRISLVERPSFEEAQAIFQSVSTRINTGFTVKWVDDENEWITISSARDFEEAWEFAKELPNRVLKIKLYPVLPSKIALFSHHNKYVCAESNGDAVANRDAPLAWEHFQVEDKGGYIHLKSCHGKYLCAEPNGRVVCDRERADIWERWTVTRVSENLWCLKSYHGKYLCAELDGSLVANRKHNKAWEMFTVLDFSSRRSVRFA